MLLTPVTFIGQKDSKRNNLDFKIFSLFVDVTFYLIHDDSSVVKPIISMIYTSIFRKERHSFRNGHLTLTTFQLLLTKTCPLISQQPRGLEGLETIPEDALCLHMLQGKQRLEN
jgi:hypothetical protein